MSTIKKCKDQREKWLIGRNGQNTIRCGFSFITPSIELNFVQFCLDFNVSMCEGDF